MIPVVVRGRGPGRTACSWRLGYGLKPTQQGPFTEPAGAVPLTGPEAPGGHLGRPQDRLAQVTVKERDKVLAAAGLSKLGGIV